jgi:hypothetical protein
LLLLVVIRNLLRVSWGKKCAVLSSREHNQ